MNKRPDITDATKLAFMEAFIQLNRALPVEKITVKKLTEKAGYNRTTFYNYFADVYALQDYTEEYICKELEVHISNNLRNVEDRDSFVQTIVGMVTKWRSWTEVLLKNPTSHHIEDHIKRPIVDYLKEQNHIAPDDVQADFRLYYLASGSLAIMSRWLQDPEVMTIEELASLLQDILENGILHGIGPFSA